MATRRERSSGNHKNHRPARGCAPGIRGVGTGETGLSQRRKGTSEREAQGSRNRHRALGTCIPQSKRQHANRDPNRPAAGNTTTPGVNLARNTDLPLQGGTGVPPHGLYKGLSADKKRAAIKQAAINVFENFTEKPHCWDTWYIVFFIGDLFCQPYIRPSPGQAPAPPLILKGSLNI